MAQLVLGFVGSATLHPAHSLLPSTPGASSGRDHNRKHISCSGGPSAPSLPACAQAQDHKSPSVARSACAVVKEGSAKKRWPTPQGLASEPSEGSNAGPRTQHGTLSTVSPARSAGRSPNWRSEPTSSRPKTVVRPTRHSRHRTERRAGHGSDPDPAGPAPERSVQQGGGTQVRAPAGLTRQRSLPLPSRPYPMQT
jgi:hypothetical protein